MSRHLISALLFATSWCNVSAQEYRPYSKTSMNEILRLAKKNDTNAIGELGLRGDQSVIPLLKQILSEEIPTLSTAAATAPGTNGWVRRDGERLNMARMRAAKTESRIALARLGDKESIDAIIKELSSSDGHTVDAAILALHRIKNKSTVKYLIPFLDDVDPEKMPPSEASATMPYALAAHAALINILPDVANRIDQEKAQSHLSGITLWKQWWQQNKDAFEKENP